MVRPHQAIFDGNLAGNQIDEPAMHEMRRHAARPAFVQHDGFAGDAGQAADARTDERAGAQPLLLAHAGETGIFQRLAGGVDAIDDEGIDLPLNLVIDPEIRIKILRLHLARDGAGIVARVKARDGGRARLAGDQPLPRGFDRRAQRRDQPQACDDYSAHPPSLPVVPAL